ncbi:MAG: hypothetical protein WAL25_13200 [Acidimicrobiia bacterium]
MRRYDRDGYSIVGIIQKGYAMKDLAVRPVVEPVASSGPKLACHVYLVSLAAAMFAAVAAALTYFSPGVLMGPPAANGNARGTALVVFALAVPVLLSGIWMTGRGQWRGLFIWAGALFYLGYNGFLFLFLTPFNQLFLWYIAMFSTALFGSIALIGSVEYPRLLSGIRQPPVRALAIYVWALVALNTLAWLRVVVPGLSGPTPGSFLEGTGVMTNPIYVQDLAFWLPGAAIAAWWLWKRRPIGVLLTGSWIAFGVLEGIGVAVDQWFGHVADPASPVASFAAIPIMLFLALLSAVALYFYIRPNAHESRRVQ